TDAACKRLACDLVCRGTPENNINLLTPGCANPGAHPKPWMDRLPRSVGCVSRLMKYKGLQLALKAFSTVVNQTPDAKLLVAGSGPYQSELAKITIELGISKNVRFLGRVSENS